MVTASRRREAVSHLRTAYGVSERRGCRTIGMARASYRYRSVADLQSELRVRLRELAAARVRYGYRRLWVLLRREGYIVNHKRIVCSPLLVSLSILMLCRGILSLPGVYLPLSLTGGLGMYLLP